jgi:ABC-type Zn2+ transport system substrate-binding protein/surface adhesin
MFNGGNKNQTKQVHKIDLKYTQGYLDEKGHFVKVGDYSRKEDMQNVIAQQAPEKWSTKIAIIIGILVILAIAFPSVAINLWLKAKANIKQIVTGVEQAKLQMTPDQKAILETNLSKKMDAKAKAQVKKIKTTIKADDLTKPAV